MKIKFLTSFVSKLTVRERVVFYATVGAVCLVLLDRIILTPILGKIENLTEAIRSQEENIEQSLIVVTQEDRIEAESSQYSLYLSEPQSEEKVITAFLKEIETLAKKSSVYLIDIKSSGKKVDGEIVRHFVKLNFEAQMDQVISFFYSVTNFEQLVKIDAYQVRPKTEGSSIIVCSVSISKSIILK